MKVVIIGSDEVYAMEHFFLKHLDAMPDVEVCLVAMNKWIHENISFIRKIGRRINPSHNDLYTKLNRFIKDQITYLKPDVILVFKGMELYPDTLKNFKNQGILLTNFNPDHPFVITSRGSGNWNVGKSIALYDLHFCYSVEVLNRIKKMYNIPVVHLPFGFELPTEFLKNELPQEEKIAVCFIGTADKIRINAVKELLAANIPVHVYGSEWHKFLDVNFHPNLKIEKPVYGIEYWRLAIQYRVQLNVFRPHNEGSHNMRTFEMPAVGAIMLAPDSVEHRMFFEADQEVIYYSSKEEMILKAQYLLDLPVEKANQIRIQAKNRSIQSGYSYRDRVNTIYQAIKELLP